MADPVGTIPDRGEIASSCRLDWLSLSYGPKTPRDMEEILQYFFFTSKTFAPGSQYREGAGRRFFTESLTNPDAGILLRWTPHGGGINAGKVSIDLQGSFFKFTDADDRKAVYLDVFELPGFSKCTRLDTQATIVDPIANSEEVYRQVRDREIWIPGYNSYSQLSPVDSKGDATNGASTCWGAPSAAVRCLTYNKALEQGLKGANIVRHEIRNRKLAAEGYFIDLLRVLREEGEDADSYAERLFTRSVLAKHMTYLDTSRLKSHSDKASWPKNWAKHSAPASFMSEVLDGDVTEVKRAYRVGKRLEESVRASQRQYGALISLWVEYMTEEHGFTYEDAQDAFFAGCNTHLKDHHFDELCRLLPNIQEKALRDKLQARRASGARALEELARYELG